jgi:hypothetical protein
MSDTPLAGRVAVVSGGGRGLGRSFCLALARQGAKVVVNNRNRVTDADGRGPIRLARAAVAVMRPAGYGRIILVGSTGGLHGDVGLSAYAASKGGLLAFGRSLAAEGAGKGVLTNMLLPYALTQMTDDGMPSEARGRMDPDQVALVLTALASPECRLNGEYLVTGGGRLRRASVVEWGTVLLPNGPDLSPGQLHALLAESGRGGTSDAGARAHRDLGAAAGRAHLFAQPRAGRGQAVRLAAAAQPREPGGVRAALHLLDAGPGHVVRVAAGAGGHVRARASFGGEHARQAHRQAAAREAHGAFQGGGVRRLRSAH